MNGIMQNKIDKNPLETISICLLLPHTDFKTKIKDRYDLKYPNGLFLYG